MAGGSVLKSEECRFPVLASTCPRPCGGLSCPSLGCGQPHFTLAPQSRGMRAPMLLLAACCGHASAGALTESAGPFPLLPITPVATNAAPWALPNPKLPFPVGPNPGLKYEDEAGSDRRRLQPPAPRSKQGLLLGDVRVRLHVTAELVSQAKSTVTAQIFW